MNDSQPPPDPSAADPSGGGYNPAMYAAMLYGGGGGFGFGGRGGAMVDPRFAMLQPTLQFGQGLLQQATDASAVRSPWQAVARAVGGLLGGYEVGQYGQQMGQVLGQQAQERAAADQRVQGIYQGLTPSPAAAAPTPANAPPEFSDVVENASKASGIPKPVLVGLFKHESGFNPNAVNAQSGAAGIGQVLPSTAADPGYDLAPLAKEDMLDPQKNANFSAQYLAARGKAIYGDQWDPTNTQQLRAALNGYGDGTAGYADAVLSKAGVVPASPSAIAADPQANAYHGLQAYQALMAEAARRAESYDPQLRATAPFIQAQALQMLNVGRYVNTRDPTGAMVTTDTLTNKPATAVAAPRPEVWNQQQMQVLQAKVASGQPLSPADQALLNGRIVSDYKPTVDDKGAVKWGVPPPNWIDQYYRTQSGMMAAAPSAPAPPTPGGPAAPPQTSAQIELFQRRAGEKMAADDKTVQETQAATRQGEASLANSQNIRSMISAGAASGWSAEARTDAGRVLSELGYDDKTVQSWTGANVPASQVANKIMLGLVTEQAKAMGPREAFSTIQMLRGAYPNLETDPRATEAMSRIVDASQYYARDKAAAMANYQRARVNELSSGKVGYGQYAGLDKFDTEFAKTHDIRTYAAAALALARNQQGLPQLQFKDWGGALNDAQQTQALANVMRLNGGRPVTVNLAHGNATITPEGVQQMQQGLKMAPDNPDFGL